MDQPHMSQYRFLVFYLATDAAAPEIGVNHLLTFTNITLITAPFSILIIMITSHFTIFNKILSLNIIHGFCFDFKFFTK